MIKLQFLKEFVETSTGDRVTFLTPSGLVSGVLVSESDTSDAIEFVRDFMSALKPKSGTGAGFITLRDVEFQGSQAVRAESFTLFIDQIVGVVL